MLKAVTYAFLNITYWMHFSVCFNLFFRLFFGAHVLFVFFCSFNCIQLDSASACTILLFYSILFSLLVGCLLLPLLLLLLLLTYYFFLFHSLFSDWLLSDINRQLCIESEYVMCFRFDIGIREPICCLHKCISQINLIGFSFSLFFSILYIFSLFVVFVQLVSLAFIRKHICSIVRYFICSHSKLCVIYAFMRFLHAVAWVNNNIFFRQLF